MRLVEPQRHMLLQIKSVVTWEQKGHKMIPDGKRPDGTAQKKRKYQIGQPRKRKRAGKKTVSRNHGPCDYCEFDKCPRESQWQVL